MQRFRPGVHAEHAHYKWWALSCTSLGMLLATTNSGTLIIALPDLERALGTSLLAAGLGDPRLHDRLDRAGAHRRPALRPLRPQDRPTSAASSIFALASLGAGFAADGTELILWRILQGIGGAFLFANAAALVTDAFPREQLGLAMGTNTMVAAIGLVLGPVLGGALVAISWHWVFWFNVPLGAGRRRSGAALVLRELAKPRPGARPRPGRHRHLRRRPDRARLRDLARRHLRLERPARDRRPGRRPRCCCRSSS